MIVFNNSYAALPGAFFEKIQKKNSFKPSLLAFNHELAQELGLGVEDFENDAFAKYFSACDFLPGSEPIAMAYAGHQFGHFVPQLGDGRAMLLGEVTAREGKKYDVHLKGSGRTSFSRRGDGLSALGPVVREYLISEAMHALGVPTTRTLAAVRTNEFVQREKMQPGGVLTRLALGHIRVGTFQFFAMRGDLENLKILADYSIERFYPTIKNSENKYFSFWQSVAQKQLALIARWMSVGFIHGVMNTDNMAISGETIDFGPCAFMDEFKIDKVFSSIDQQGRYAYSNQPRIALWNLARLAECLIPLMGTAVEEIQKSFEQELAVYQGQLRDTYLQNMAMKIGLREVKIGDELLIHQWLELLEKTETDFTLGHIDLERIVEKKSSFLGLEKKEGFAAFFQSLYQRHQESGLSLDEIVGVMKTTNPLTIPRNHQVEKVISACEQGSDELFFRFLSAIKKPFERTEALTEFQLPPEPLERVTKTFCGT